jgi:murein DD-endopeptidase MepM/ murein hydrolase activator NlpD
MLRKWISFFLGVAIPCFFTIAAVHPGNAGISSKYHSMFDEVLVRDELKLALSSLVEESKSSIGAPNFMVPAEGRITSAFGMRSDPFHRGRRFHAGIDIANVKMSKIRAAADGIVVFAARRGGHGRTVIIDHGNGFETQYSHLIKFSVREGDVVHAGDIIAGMGSTGRSTGTHLHFEVHEDGKPVDPLSYLMISMVQFASR